MEESAISHMRGWRSITSIIYFNWLKTWEKLWLDYMFASNVITPSCNNWTRACRQNIHRRLTSSLFIGRCFGILSSCQGLIELLAAWEKQNKSDSSNLGWAWWTGLNSLLYRILNGFHTSGKHTKLHMSSPDRFDYSFWLSNVSICIFILIKLFSLCFSAQMSNVR